MRKSKWLVIGSINMFILYIEFKLRGFDKVITRYFKKYENVDSRNIAMNDIGVDNINSMIDAVETISVNLPLNMKCLHRSLIQYKFLKGHYKMPVKLVIGVKKFPFSSHAWIKWNYNENNSNVLQNEDETNEYKIIIDSSTYGGD